jgi:hypothetical protein
MCQSMTIKPWRLQVTLDMHNNNACGVMQQRLQSYEPGHGRADAASGVTASLAAPCLQTPMCYTMQQLASHPFTS